MLTPKSDGPDAVSYQFAQVGNDRGAQQFLSSLDDDPTIGSLIDQTMEYEYEQQQMMQKTGHNLSPEMWLQKLLLGPIDNSYDMKGELMSKGSQLTMEDE